MADGYKIKTDDGSVLGPMSLEGVEGYFRQGLVRHDDMVQRPGSYNWVPLSEVLAKDLKKAAATKKKKAAPPAPAPQPARPRPPAARPDPSPSAGSGGAAKAAAALIGVLVLSGGGFFAYTMLRDTRPAPTPAPAPTPDVSQQALQAQREKALDAAAAETPQFARGTLEFLMANSSTQVLEPHEAFRRGHVLVTLGIPKLSGAESRELGGLMQAVYGTLTGQDRGRLGGYLDKLKSGALTRPEEDRAATQAMKTGVSKLSKERRARLQALFDKAVRAGAAGR